MSESALKKLQAERTQLRRVFTLAYNELDKLLKEEASTLEVEEQYHKLADKAERLIQVDQKVSALMFEVITDEKELEKEFDLIENYRDQWNDISFRKDTLINKRNEIRGDVEHDVEHFTLAKSTDSSHKLKFKLPPFEFKKFDGNIKNWISFWAQFHKIHEDPAVDLEDKFQVLLSATLENSPARELVESFPPSGANYNTAIQQLKNRFGRDKLIMQFYMRELLKLVLTNKGKTLPLRVLYDQLATQIRALETLGLTSDRFATMLYPLVESAIPENILRIWERHRSNRSEDPIEDEKELSELLEFLRKEVESEERLSLARQSFSSNNNNNDDKSKSVEFKKKSNFNRKAKTPTVAALANTKKFSKPNLVCIFCDGPHLNESCFKAQEMSLAEIENIVKNKDLCLNCLRKGHNIRQCKTSLKCIICGNKHVLLVCPERKINKTKNSDNTNDGSVEQTLANLSSANVSPLGQALANTSFPKVIMQTLVVNVIGNSEQKARVLIDTGSQRSYITKKLASLMGYDPLKNERIVHALFGGVTSELKKHVCYKVRLSSLDKKYACNFEAMDTEVICQTVPVAAKGSWYKELINKGIYLTDMNEGPIDILIGADIAGKIITGRREELSSGLVALETSLGWTLMGKTSCEETDQVSRSSINTYMSLYCDNQSVSELWRLDIIGIEEPSQIKNREEKEAIARRHFLDTSSILPDGRYEVRLPWLPDHPLLPRNFHLAHRRMERTVEKLKNTNMLNDYNNVFLEWLENDIIEVVPSNEWDVGHYFPHRPVFKEDSTTKIRPVFDASASTKGSPSLNQCLEKGQNLIELIPSILIRFRMEKIGVVSDIKKAFLQISVHPQDRDVLHFLFVDKAGELIIYRHKRVVFGVSSSPFLLGAVIEHHLNRYENLIINEAVSYSADIVTKLKKSFYVDNCVASVPDERELQQFVAQSTAIFKEACFELRGWEWTDSSLIETKNTAVLGLIWDRKRDKLKLNPKLFCCKDENVITKITRRVMLSVTQKIFDPIGLSTPTTLVPKLLIQKTWISGQNWDDEVDEEIKNKFIKWIEEIHWLKDVEVDRWFIGLTKENQQLSLHTFCDASQVTYAAVVFLRIEEDEDVYIHLVEAKSRVTPVKKVSTA